MFFSRPVDFYDQHMKRYLLIIVGVLFIFSLKLSKLKKKKKKHLFSSWMMFVAAAGVAAYGTPRYKLKLMRASWLL